MQTLIIDKNSDIQKQVKLIKMKSKKTIFVFDIHKTTLKEDGSPDLEVKKYIKQLIYHKYNIIFLSYDGNNNRIIHNNKILNKITEYKKIPKIFIKKRKKQLVLKELCKNVNFDKRLKYKAILIDDNINNIKDVLNLRNNSIIPYYYTKNNRYEGYNTLSNLGNIFNVLKLSKSGHFKTSKN